MTVKLNHRLKCLLAFFCMHITTSNAQSVGSESIYGGPLSTVSIVAGATYADVSETLYIGPGTYEINGTWEIYSKNVVIDPAAIITGSGTIHFYNPSVAGGASSPTLIDGNDLSQPIGVAIVHQNASGMQLVNTDFPADLVAAGFSNNSASGYHLRQRRCG